MCCLQCHHLRHHLLVASKHSCLHAGNDSEAIAVSEDLLDKLHGIARLLPLKRMNSRVSKRVYLVVALETLRAEPAVRWPPQDGQPSVPAEQQRLD